MAKPHTEAERVMSAPESNFEFEPVEYKSEWFDREWQTHIGLNIRLSAATLARTKQELREGFEVEPDAMMELLEVLTAFGKECQGYVKLVEGASARLFIVGAEIAGVPLED